MIAEKKGKQGQEGELRGIMREDASEDDRLFMEMFDGREGIDGEERQNEGIT